MSGIEKRIEKLESLAASGPDDRAHLEDARFLMDGSYDGPEPPAIRPELVARASELMNDLGFGMVPEQRGEDETIH